MIKIYPKITDIPTEIVKKCRSLSYREEGLLFEYLVHARKYHDRGYNGVVSIIV